MCFMFWQSANSGILDPNPRQDCFQQEPFVLTNTVQVSKRSSNWRQRQNEALTGSHDGPGRTPCTALLVQKQQGVVPANGCSAQSHVLGARQQGTGNGLRGVMRPGLCLLEPGSELAWGAQSHTEGIFKWAIANSTSTEKRGKQMLLVWSNSGPYRFINRGPRTDRQWWAQAANVNFTQCPECEALSV